LKTCLPNKKLQKQEVENIQSFVSTEETQNWETWHRRYGHIGYSGLQKLIDLKMVDGFTVDNNSLKPDCDICVQAKQSIEHLKEFPIGIHNPEISHI
jgi:GAG-pre-integrase domain